TEGNRLVNLAEDLLEAEDITVRRPHGPIERAEVAARDADVRVVDVAIDDVRDDAVRVFTGTDFVRQLAQQRCRRAGVQVERLVSTETTAVLHLCYNIR